MVLMSKARKKAKVCPKCRQLMTLEDDRWWCPACGKVISTKADRHKYFETNKEEILADLAEVGRSKTLSKWQIPSSTMLGLTKRWGVEKIAAQPISSPAKGSNNLPPLPEFSNEWQLEVQVKWLEVWEAQRRRIVDA